VDVQTYLFFGGDCGEALELYQLALGMEVLYKATYAEAPAELRPPGWSDQVFHATVRIGDSKLNLSDTNEQNRLGFAGFALLVHMDSGEQVTAALTSLALGGRVEMPVQQTPWAKHYGIVVDRFGLTWKLQA
jgi:PhnB protein